MKKYQISEKGKVLQWIELASLQEWMTKFSKMLRSGHPLFRLLNHLAISKIHQDVPPEVVPKGRLTRQRMKSEPSD
jgi:hypothetical protein